jgi:hypothetical protein
MLATFRSAYTERHFVKKLRLTIKAELDIPDHWELVTHKDNITVVNTGNGKFLDFDLLPMIAYSLEEGAIWNTVPQELDAEIMDMVRKMESKLDLLLN